MSEGDPRAGTPGCCQSSVSACESSQLGSWRGKGAGGMSTGKGQQGRAHGAGGRGEETETLTLPLPCGSEGKSAVSQSCQVPSQVLQVSPAKARKLTGSHARLQA